MCIAQVQGSLDQEWLELIREAKAIGLKKQEVLDFLKKTKIITENK